MSQHFITPGHVAPGLPVAVPPQAPTMPPPMAVPPSMVQAPPAQLPTQAPPMYIPVGVPPAHPGQPQMMLLPGQGPVAPMASPMVPPMVSFMPQGLPGPGLHQAQAHPALVPHGPAYPPPAFPPSAQMQPPAYHALQRLPPSVHAPPQAMGVPAAVPAPPFPPPFGPSPPALPGPGCPPGYVLQAVPEAAKAPSSVVESDATQLLVNYVADDIPTRDLEQVFEPFGALDLVRIIKDKATGKSKGYAFVYYATAGDAAAACRSLGSLPGGGYLLGSKRLKVTFADPQRPLSRRALARVAHRARKVQAAQARSLAESGSAAEAEAISHCTSASSAASSAGRVPDL